VRLSLRASGCRRLSRCLEWACVARQGRVTQRAGAIEERERVRATCTAPAGAHLSIPKLSRRFRPLQGATAQRVLRCELKLRPASTVRKATRSFTPSCRPPVPTGAQTYTLGLLARRGRRRRRFKAALQSGHRTSAIAFWSSSRGQKCRCNLHECLLPCECRVENVKTQEWPTIQV
jgi:hypothetical protein